MEGQRGRQEERGPIILFTRPSSIPALSIYCAQMSLGEGDMDVIYMNGWVGVFQLLLTLPAALPSAAIQHMPLSQVRGGYYTCGGAHGDDNDEDEEEEKEEEEDHIEYQ